MGKITESQLKANLKGGLSRVYFLYGEEDFLVKTYAEKIIAAAIGDGDRDMNFVKYTDAPSSDELSDYLESLPFFAEYKCVLIEDLDLDALDAAEQKAYLSLIASVPETSVLIIEQLHTDPLLYDAKKGKAKPKKLLDAAAKAGEACELKFLPLSKVGGMAVRKIQRAGCDISDENAIFLAEECGRSLTVLGNEIDKLTAYKKSGEITREDIEALVPKRVDAGIYTLSDALFAGQSENAFRIFDELILQSYEPHTVFAVLSGYFVDLYRAKLAASAGEKADEAAAAFSYPPNMSFKIRNAYPKVKKLPLGYLADCVTIMYRTNKLLNSSRADRRTLVEKAMTEISALEK